MPVPCMLPLRCASVGFEGAGPFSCTIVSLLPGLPCVVTQALPVTAPRISTAGQRLWESVLFRSRANGPL